MGIGILTARSGAAALLALLPLACPAAASLRDACGPGARGPARLVSIKVVLEDAGGRQVPATVEADGVAVGRTEAVLRVPLCTARLRAVAAAGSWEQPIALDQEFTVVRASLARPTPPPAPGPAPAAAPPAPAAAAATPAAPKLAAGLVVPEARGKAVIHYHRPGGDYGGWGLHTWESFNKLEEVAQPDAGKLGSDRLLPGIDWETPMPPTGADAFGVYWEVPGSAYRNGRVNFIVHSGSTKELCGDEGFFLLQRTRAVWLVAGACELFSSEAAARAAR